MKNIILVGPCGVGKSTIGKNLAYCREMAYYDFDEIRTLNMEGRRGVSSPFSISYLNFYECLPIIISTINSNGSILDIGGDTVFRKNVDNFERLNQIQWIKNTYKPIIFVLSAQKKVLSERFFSTRTNSFANINEIWSDWKKISEPNWKKIGDFFIDTSHLSINSTVEKIIEILDHVDL